MLAEASGAHAALLAVSERTAAPTLEAVFRQHHDFVWSSVRRLGAPPGSVDDAVQEVFLIVARKLAQLERPEALRTWLFRIAIGVVRNHRRGHARRAQRDALAGQQQPSHAPDEYARHEAAAELLELLEVLDEGKRAVFVLATFEQLSAPEIAEALGLNLNTVYSRLRLAREQLERAVARRKETP
jgi:RNA polymerase sigma-70 factor (ECF subfamily)